MNLLAIAFVVAGTLTPLSAAEKAELEGEPCEPFVTAFKSAARKAKPAKGVSPDAAMAAVLAGLERPATIKKAQWQRCSVLFERSLREYKARSVETEARALLKAFATGMTAAFEDTGALCPSTKAPVPPDLKQVADGPFHPKAEDWSDPAWKCLYATFDSPNQRFQYELETDLAAGTFVLIARGYPAADGTLVTFRLAGKVVSGAIQLGELQRE